jgi:adenylate cyclase
MADSHSNGASSRRSLRRLRRIIFATVATGLTGLIVAAYAGGVFDGAELDTVDQRFQIRGSDGAPRDLVVVGIDDVTFGDLRERWPFPRSFHARAVTRLSESGARVIAYDIQFTEPTTARDDNALISAVEHAEGVVLATTEVARDGGSGVLGGDELLREIGARAANSNFVNDEDGVIRRLPYEVDGLVSFSIAAAE